MTWLPAAAAGSTEFARVFGLRPNLFADYRDFASLIWTQPAADPILLELCRVRIAQILVCPSEWRRRCVPSTPLLEEKITALSGWPAASVFSPAERACLAFAEKFVRNPRDVSDDDAAAVVAHLTAAGMVGLTEALALFDGFTRFRVILDIDDG